MFLGLVWIDFPSLSQKDPSFGKLGHVINPLTPGALCKKQVFLDISAVFRLDFGQISFNPVENAFATRQLAILATGNTFCDILVRHALKSKF